MEAHELHSCTFSLVLTLINTPEFDIILQSSSYYDTQNMMLLLQRVI